MIQEKTSGRINQQAEYLHFVKKLCFSRARSAIFYDASRPLISLRRKKEKQITISYTINLLIDLRELCGILSAYRKKKLRGKKMKLGFIGGSGLYQIDGIEKIRKAKVKTPFGDPSDEFITGKLSGVDAVFLPRHGKGHTILPAELNHKANIFAMKKLGVTHIFSISAVGSLKEKLVPRDVVIVDQYFDRTKKSLEHTFFGNGIVGHIAFGQPVCPESAKTAYEAAKASIKESPEAKKSKIHMGGSYVNMEGPAFSTKAESNSYRSLGFDVIGMTNLGEAKLAREAEICYCTIAMVTDFDCWHPDHDHVTVEMIVGNLIANSGLAKKIIMKIASMSNKLQRKCQCPDALKCALITNKDFIPSKLKRDLKPIIGKYII